MKIAITVDKDDIKNAITDWIAKQPALQLVKDKDLEVSWTGGSMVVKDGKPINNSFES